MNKLREPRVPLRSLRLKQPNKGTYGLFHILNRTYACFVYIILILLLIKYYKYTTK